MIEQVKICPGCKQEIPYSGFYKSGDRKDGLQVCCKECTSKRNGKISKANLARETVVVPDFKVCLGCREGKANSEFYESKRFRDGLSRRCKDCFSKESALLHKRNCSREIVIYSNSKWCPGCKTEKTSERFYKDRGNSDGLSGYCKDCDRRSNYGITEEQYRIMLIAQGGACAICRFVPGPEDRSLCVDHEHVKGWWEMPLEERKLYVRGLLCDRCNTGLGCFRDRIDILNLVIDYLNAPDLKIPYKRKIDKEVRDSILVDQKWLCKICSADLSNKKACVDHDHLTMMIRGILCQCCNVGIGRFKDCLEFFQAAICYLNKCKQSLTNSGSGL